MTSFLSIWRGEVARPKLSAQEILARVAADHGLGVGELKSRTKLKRIIVARWHAMHALYETGRFSTTQVGRLVGGFDHTTVLYGLQRHSERIGEAAHG